MNGVLQEWLDGRFHLVVDVIEWDALEDKFTVHLIDPTKERTDD